MAKALRTVGAGLLIALTAGLVAGGNSPQPVRPAISVGAPVIPQAVSAAISSAIARDEKSVDMTLQVSSPGELDQLKQSVSRVGGKVLSEDRTTMLVRIPAAAAGTIANEQPVIATGVNQSLPLDPTNVGVKGQALDAQTAAELTEVSMDPIGVNGFQSAYDSRGRGVVVAVIDSGVDPGHPALRQTSDGHSKIIDWKDFTGEGYVETSTPVDQTSGEFTAPDGRQYVLPDLSGSSGVRFGYWSEYNAAGYINRDLDRDGTQTERFGVLLIDSGNGQYDTVYVDTNNDGSFTDEQSLRLFSKDQSVGKMGKFREGALGQRRLNFAVADIDPAGQWVSFGFDGLGHGTQVAGVLGGYTPGGYSGVAPDVQIMALKAVFSDGNGDWFAIRQAIKYAAVHGASVINVSVGGLAAAAAKFDATASEWMNQIAREYGVLIILAADNSGPGLSSGATLGNPSEVMAVGAYYSPAMWKRDFGYVVPHESIWSLSGMGPRSDGSYLPSVVAPGGSPTTSPLWRDSTGYTTAVGTSIAAPYASGAAALLMQAAKRDGAPYDRFSVKRALEMGARKIPGFGVYEQGNGLISLVAAYNNLKQMNPAPILQARSPEGGGGLLARSFIPGSTSFSLTNLDRNLTRVSILSAEDWVHVDHPSLTLPPNVPRQIPVALNPPDSPGVHSAFVMVASPGRYGSDLSIPITYVQPVDLSPAGLSPGNEQFITGDTLEVARFQRYFIPVKPGSSAFSVTGRVLPDTFGTALGTIEVHVFRPDGQAVYASDIGAQGTGLSAPFTTADPVAGVWEVVITALPDAQGKYLSAAYSLRAETQRGFIADQTQPEVVSNRPLELTVPAGATTTIPLKFTNPFGAFNGHVEALGILKPTASDPGADSVPWRVERKLQNVVDDFTVNQLIRRMRVEIGNAVPAKVDLDLYLYYLDPVLGWQLRQASLTPDSSNEAIELTNLPAGRYEVLSVVNGDTPEGLQFQYRRLMGLDGYNLQLADPVRMHQLGDLWTANLTVTAPTIPGRYTGQLLLRDTDNQQTLQWIPFVVSVGQPALSVAPMVPELVRGQPGNVVLEIRNAATRVLVDATVTVNGERYISQNGRVTVPVTPQGDTQGLDVDADVPGYQFVHQQITVPVGDHVGIYPMGVDTNQELTEWRRKVISQLP